MSPARLRRGGLGLFAALALALPAGCAGYRAESHDWKDATGRGVCTLADGLIGNVVAP